MWLVTFVHPVVLFLTICVTNPALNLDGGRVTANAFVSFAAHEFPSLLSSSSIQQHGQQESWLEARRIAMLSSIPSPNEKGREFEQAVAKLLSGLAIAHPKLVTVETKLRVTLQNDEFVVPDFQLTVELSHQRSHCFIECQNREQDSKSILHKIQHVRNKQRWKSFLFLYPDTIAPELSRALDAEGIIHLNLSGFQLYVERLQASLSVQPEIEPEKSKPDAAMLSSPSKEPSFDPWKRR